MLRVSVAMARIQRLRTVIVLSALVLGARCCAAPPSARDEARPGTRGSSTVGVPDHPSVVGCCRPRSLRSRPSCESDPECGRSRHGWAGERPAGPSGPLRLEAPGSRACATDRRRACDSAATRCTCGRRTVRDGVGSPSARSSWLMPSADCSTRRRPTPGCGTGAEVRVNLARPGLAVTVRVDGGTPRAIRGGRERSINLYANSGLHPGRNVLTVQALDAGRGVYQQRVLRVTMPSTIPVAAAGISRRAKTGHAIQFSAAASVKTSPGQHLVYRWTIVTRPRGSAPGCSVPVARTRSCGRIDRGATSSA